MASKETDFKPSCEPLDIIEVLVNLVEYLLVAMRVNLYSASSSLHVGVLNVMSKLLVHREICWQGSFQKFDKNFTDVANFRDRGVFPAELILSNVPLNRIRIAVYT